jgi:hypothetical protein
MTTQDQLLDPTTQQPAVPTPVEAEPPISVNKFVQFGNRRFIVTAVTPAEKPAIGQPREELTLDPRIDMRVTIKAYTYDLKFMGIIGNRKARRAEHARFVKTHEALVKAYKAKNKSPTGRTC